MLPDSAEFCPKTRVRMSAECRSPGQGVQDLGRGGTSFQAVMEYLWEEAGFRTVRE